MTDRELLERIANEIKTLKSDVKNEFQEMKSNVKNEFQEIKSDIKLIKTQQSEHSEMIQAVGNAQESQMAQIDQLTYAVARIEGHQKESEKIMDQMAGDITFLVRKSAEHDDDIRELRQAK